MVQVQGFRVDGLDSQVQGSGFRLKREWEGGRNVCTLQHYPGWPLLPLRCSRGKTLNQNPKGGREVRERAKTWRPLNPKARHIPWSSPSGHPKTLNPDLQGFWYTPNPNRQGLVHPKTLLVHQKILTS